MMTLASALALLLAGGCWSGFVGVADEPLVFGDRRPQRGDRMIVVRQVHSESRVFRAETEQALQTDVVSLDQEVRLRVEEVQDKEVGAVELTVVRDDGQISRNGRTQRLPSYLCGDSFRVRRTGRVRTVVDADDRPVDDATTELVRELLGGEDAPLFDTHGGIAGFARGRAIEMNEVVEVPWEVDLPAGLEDLLVPGDSAGTPFTLELVAVEGEADSRLGVFEGTIPFDLGEQGLPLANPERVELGITARIDIATGWLRCLEVRSEMASELSLGGEPMQFRSASSVTVRVNYPEP